MIQEQITTLLETIGYPENGELSYRTPSESTSALEIAAANKVDSLYLASLEETGELDVLEDDYRDSVRYQEQFTDTCDRINDLLRNQVEFAFVKSIHPFPADASDVDIAIFDVDDFRSLPINFESNDYEILGTAPSAATLEDQRTGQLVDLQSFFGLHKVVYYNHDQLARNITTTKVSDTELPTPEQAFDLSLIVNHSVTELMFLLKEYYATVYMLETADEDSIWDFIEDIRYNRSEPGCAAFLAIVQTLSGDVFSIQPKHMDLLQKEIGISDHEKSVFRERSELPYRYSRKTLTRFTLRKFREQQFRRSFLRGLPSFANPKTALYILRKVYGRQSRETY